MTEPPGATGPARTGSITVAGATAIGVGGMMGAGLYTLVGKAVATRAGGGAELALLLLLLGYTIHAGPASTWLTVLAVLALSFVFEVVNRRRTGGSLALESTAT